MKNEKDIAKKYLKLLNKKEIENEIINVYCNIHKKKWNDEDPDLTYKIELGLDGQVYYTEIGKNILDISGGLTIAYVDDFPIVTIEELGDIHNVEDYEKFISRLTKEAKVLNKNIEEYLEKNATWSEYYEFNYNNYIQIERDIWNKKCDYYDKNIIKSKLNVLCEELKQLLK